MFGLAGPPAVHQFGNQSLVMRATDHGRPYTGAVLNEKAYAARRRLKVDDGDLVGMLEIVEAARLWALLDQEEA